MNSDSFSVLDSPEYCKVVTQIISGKNTQTKLTGGDRNKLNSLRKRLERLKFEKIIIQESNTYEITDFLKELVIFNLKKNLALKQEVWKKLSNNDFFIEFFEKFFGPDCPKVCWFDCHKVTLNNLAENFFNYLTSDFALSKVEYSDSDKIFFYKIIRQGIVQKKEELDKRKRKIDRLMPVEINKRRKPRKIKDQDSETFLHTFLKS